MKEMEINSLTWGLLAEFVSVYLKINKRGKTWSGGMKKIKMTCHWLVLTFALSFISSFF